MSDNTQVSCQVTVAPYVLIEADHAVKEVSAGAMRYVGQVVEDGQTYGDPTMFTNSYRAGLLRRIIPRLQEMAKAITSAACDAKGIKPGSVLANEDMMQVMLSIRNAQLLAKSLDSMTFFQDEPHAHLKRRRLVDSHRQHAQMELDVFPTSAMDAFLFQGFRASVRVRPSPTTEVKTVRPTIEPRTCLVLGAGNVLSIPLMDIFYKMFAEGQACVLKMNPVNEYLAPFFQRACQELIDAGLLRIVRGGAEVGEYLCHHPLIDTVHVTGSDATFEAIVWGKTPEERARRKAANDPLLKKPITAELGNVSPVIVYPGRYSEEELRFIAKNVVTMLVNNAGFNCNAARVIVTAKYWEQREAFLAFIRAELKAAEPRVPYYPGAVDRYMKFAHGLDPSNSFGTQSPDKPLPWHFVTDLDSQADDPLFSNETFCGIMAETALDSPDGRSFLEEVVQFANERLKGTLNVTVFIDPRSERNKDIAWLLEQAITDLRYGTVAINHWGALGYGLVSTPWGAYPGGTLHDPQSGIGFVHNTYLIDDIEKCVIRGPLVVKPMPPWFAGNPHAYKVACRLVEQEAAPSWWKTIRVALAALGL
jgi:Aldehyde dehydrogenase family